METERTVRDAEDAEWLEAYGRRGDVEALGRLVEKYRGPLYGYILRSAAGKADADECYQETWLRALRGLGRFDREHFGAWLFRIARNWLIDEGRRKKPDVSLDAESAGEGGTLAERIESPEAAPDAESARAELGRRIRAAAEGLPEEQREVFWLRMDAGLSFKDIAAAQGCSLNTALARMRYALEKMRRSLAEDWRRFCGGEG